LALKEKGNREWIDFQTGEVAVSKGGGRGGLAGNNETKRQRRAQKTSKKIYRQAFVQQLLGETTTCRSQSKEGLQTREPTNYGRRRRRTKSRPNSSRKFGFEKGRCTKKKGSPSPKIIGRGLSKGELGKKGRRNFP